MKLKLKTILTSMKAEVSLQGKYRLNKNSMEPPMMATAAKSYLQVHLCEGTSKALPPRRCLSTSAESFNASIFETGDKRSPTDKLVISNNNLEHFTRKERN